MDGSPPGRGSRRALRPTSSDCRGAPLVAMAEPLRSCLQPPCTSCVRARRRLVGRRRAASSLTQLPTLTVASPQCIGSPSSHGRAASSLPLLIPWRKMDKGKRTRAIRNERRKVSCASERKEIYPWSSHTLDFLWFASLILCSLVLRVAFLDQSVCATSPDSLNLHIFRVRCPI
jgi:hypothetical protein